MNEILHDSDSTKSPSLGDGPRAQRLGTLPTWPWLLLIGALLVVVAVLATLLVVRGSGSGETITVPSSSASPSSLPTPNASANATTPTPAPPAKAPSSGDPNAEGPFDSGMKGRIADILNSQDIPKFGDLFSDPVEVYVLGGQDKAMSPDEATMAISFMFTPNDPYAWDLDLPVDYLNVYRAHYPDLFPTWAIVAKSHNKAVFSFLGHGSTITTVVVVASEGALG